MPSLLNVTNLEKSIGDLELFHAVSFVLNEGQKTALVARNGIGKTTLLNILGSKDSYDSGQIEFMPDVVVEYLPQEPHLDESDTIIESVFKSNNPITLLIKRYEEALASNQTDVLEKLIPELDHHKAWDYENRIKQILSQLNIENLNQKVGSLSGGQKKRIALANALINEPDLLLLDEPTNHLDVAAIEWLENYLQRTKMTLLMVTHDRYFLDRVCNEIIEIDNKTTYQYQGNFSYFLEKREQRVENEKLEVEKAKNLLRKEEDWMRRMPKARGTKAKYRIDNYYELKDKASSEHYEKDIKIGIEESRLGSKILEAKNIDFSWGNQKYLDDFSYTFSRFEKVGIIGENGSGKSTLLDVLTQKLVPENGTIETGEAIRFGYYRQEGIQFNEQMRVIDAVTEIAETIRLADGNSISAMQFLNRFLFAPERQHDYIYKLSGGEKRRLYLCTVLMQNPNFLILDEPTNDLDIVTLHVLEEYLHNFNGCVIVVSHDRYFMDQVVDHLFVFKDKGVIKDFPGNYSAYFEKKKEEEKQAVKEQKADKPDKPKAPERKPSNKLSFKEKHEFEQLEKELEELETEKEQLEEQLNSGELAHDELLKVSNRVGELIELIDMKSDRWLELSEKN